MAIAAPGPTGSGLAASMDSISFVSLRKLPFASSISALQALIAKAPDADSSVTLALWTVLRGQVTQILSCGKPSLE